MFEIHIKPSTRTATATGSTILQALTQLSNGGDADGASDETVWHITVSLDDKQILHSEVIAPTWDLAVARFRSEVLGI